MITEWGSLRAATSARSTRPFLKWYGGKTRLIGEISKYIPEYSGTYFEPFIGGGSVLFFLNPRRSIISDINPALILSYRAVRNNPKELAERLSKFPITTETIYYEKVKEFNSYLYKLYNNIELSDSDILNLAALFIWINHTCYNGRYNINRRYQFVTTYNKVDNHTVYNMDRDNLNIMSCSKVLRHAEIYNCDFRKLLDMTKDEDFVYLDPPYDPPNQNRKYSSDSKYSMYTSQGFTRSDQMHLSRIVKSKHKSGVKFIISGNDTPFLRELYKDYEMHSIKVLRNISADMKFRKETNELIVVMK